MAPSPLARQTSEPLCPCLPDLFADAKSPKCQSVAGNSGLTAQEAVKSPRKPTNIIPWGIDGPGGGQIPTEPPRVTNWGFRVSQESGTTAGPRVPTPPVSEFRPHRFPSSDPDDEVFTLGERCAEAYMQADALQYQAMKLLVEFHHRDGCKEAGFPSTAEWLAWRIGVRPGAARERLRSALALEALPQISEAMEEGALSFTKVRALTRVATPESESTLLEFAQAGSAANLERLVRGWKTLDRTSEITAEQIRHRSRRFSAFVDVDGMVVVRGRLDPEVGAMLMRAVEAANDALFREEGSSIDEPNTELQEVTPEQRRADAVGLIAESALAAGFVGAAGAGGAAAEAGGAAAEAGTAFAGNQARPASGGGSPTNTPAQLPPLPPLWRIEMAAGPGHSLHHRSSGLGGAGFRISRSLASFYGHY